MINVFIDTTLTYQDSFFKNVTNKLLIKIVEELKGTIYMSSVVLEETKHHIRKNISERIKRLKSDLNDFNKLSRTNKIIEIEKDVEKYIVQLDEFYKELHDKGIFEIVDYDNNILPIIVDRAINRKKPFSENKDEFRDAIIWLSYCNEINSNELENCYLITNNTSDYYDNGKKGLHPDLQADCNNIKLVKFAKEIIESSNNMIKNILPKAKLAKWIDENPLDDKNLIELLNNECEDRITSYLQEYFMEGNIPSNGNDMIDCLELDAFYVTDVPGSYYEIVDDEIYVSGTMKLDVYAELIAYDDDGYNSIAGSGRIEMELEFSLNHKGEEGLQGIEINGVWKFKIAEEDE